MKIQLPLCFLIALCTNVYGQSSRPAYPTTNKCEQQDTYFGTTVADPYRWLENDTLSQTVEWLASQAKLTKKYISKLDLKYGLKEDLNKFVLGYGTSEKSGKYYFDYDRPYWNGPLCLVIKKHINDFGKFVVNPYDFRQNNYENVSVANYSVSTDNRYLAFSLCRNGSDWREIRITKVFPFELQPDILKEVKFSSIEWKGNGFFYCRYPTPTKGKEFVESSLYPKIYYHTLGTGQEKDSLIYQSDDSKAELNFEVVEGEHYLIVEKSYAVRGKQRLNIDYVNLEAHNTKFNHLIITPLATGTVFRVIGMVNNKFLVFTNFNAPTGKLQLYDPVLPNQAEEFIPASVEVLHQVHLVGNKIVTVYLKDIDYNLVTFNRQGKVVSLIEYPTGTSLGDFDSEQSDSSIVFYTHSFISPYVVFRFNVNTFKVKLVEESIVSHSPDAFEMKKVFVTSKDGQKIPMVIAHQKGLKLRSNHPTILYGYGGYGNSMTPFYSLEFIFHMINGGVVAMPCLRGGGEYGRKWHEQGALLNKQNVFDDFIASAEYLIQNKYTNNDRLALMGGSNGGLLVGAVVNQRPDLCKVAISEVGVYDMLRYHLFGAGHFWEKEFGSSKDSVHFQNIYRYSPLHNIKGGVRYPAMLITTGDHDDRVVPFHSYKYVATLQEKTSGTGPILLYRGLNQGHNVGSRTLSAFKLAFMYENMGIDPVEVQFR